MFKNKLSVKLNEQLLITLTNESELNKKFFLINIIN